MTRLTWLLAASLCAACGATRSTPPAAPPAPVVSTPQVEEPDVPVASYMNPSLSTDTTQAQLAKLFEAQHIKWTAYGSLGYTLAVPASQAERARALLRADPQLSRSVHVIEAAELAQSLAPPAALAPTFQIDRVTLDAELANLSALSSSIDVRWNQPGGVLVQRVASASLFDRMGWRAGDVIVAVNGLRVHDDADAMIVAQLARTKPTLSIDLSRKGQVMAMQVVVTGSRPAP
jgi:S1-C subfamily serine protease